MTVIDEIAAERRRQIEEEGWSAKHDDKHVDGSLADAAASYACNRSWPGRIERESNQRIKVPLHWPEAWSAWWWKPTTRRRDLIKAAALIVAEIERLDRAEEQANG